MSKITWAGTDIDFSPDAGTSPNINITKEIVRASDGTCIGQRHSINISFYIFATGDAVLKQRQQVLYSKIISVFGKQSNNGVSLQKGKLEIIPETPTGGSVSQDNIITYNDAELVSFNFPETPDDTNGIQYIQCTVTFQATQPKNDIFNTYKIASVNESWSIDKATEFAGYEDSDITSDEYKYLYKIDHSISAVGLQKFSADGEMDPNEGMAWYQAWKYVNDKLSDEGADDAQSATVSKDLLLLAAPQTYEIGKWKPSTGSSNFANLDGEGYASYNRVRTSSIDIAAGSYTVNSSFIMSKYPYSFEVTGQYSQDESGELSITVEGTVSGLTQQDIKSIVNDKMTKSKLGYDQISNGDWGPGSKGRALAGLLYGKYYNSTGSCAGGLVLDNYPRSISVTENKINGTIGFNVLYKAVSSHVKSLKDTFTGAISATLSINDVNKKNTGSSIQTVAIIPIIGRTKGPIIQNMNTTSERVRTVSIEIVLGAGCRNPDASPSALALAKILEYSPANKLSAELNYVRDSQETWDWVSGKYQASITWVYQK